MTRRTTRRIIRPRTTATRRFKRPSLPFDAAPRYRGLGGDPLRRQHSPPQEGVLGDGDHGGPDVPQDPAGGTEVELLRCDDRPFDRPLHDHVFRGDVSLDLSGGFDVEGAGGGYVPFHAPADMNVLFGDELSFESQLVSPARTPANTYAH